MNKILSFLILLLSVQIGYAQQLIELRDWKCSIDAGGECTKPEYDDTGWQPVKTGIGIGSQGFEYYNFNTWYRIKFYLPSKLKQRSAFSDSLIISLGRIDNGDQTYLNGELVGQNNRHATGGKVPGSIGLSQQSPCTEERQYVISANDPNLRWDGVNVLAIAVFNGGTGGGLVSPNQYIRLSNLNEYLGIDIQSQMLDERADGRISRSVVLTNKSSLPELRGKLQMTVVNLSSNKTVATQSYDVVLKRESNNFNFEYDGDFTPQIRAAFTFTESTSGEKVERILTGHPAELSPWAYTYRSDRIVQEKPEGNFVLQRLDRLDQVYRPVSRMLSSEGIKDQFNKTLWSQVLTAKDIIERGPLLPKPEGKLQSALLWEGHMQLNRLELHFKKGEKIPSTDDVEMRVYPTEDGWFGWQWDQIVESKPVVSPDSLHWAFTGNWSNVDMVATFIKSKNGEKDNVPQLMAYGPETWQKTDIEIEWGFEGSTCTNDYSGNIQGFFAQVNKVASLSTGKGISVTGNKWQSLQESGKRRGITASLWYVEHEPTSQYPFGHPNDSRITVSTASGSFTFLMADLEKGPILAPEYGFFVTKKGFGETAKSYSKNLAAKNIKSTRQMTREHKEATWEEAMQNIRMPLLPKDAVLPPYPQYDEPDMQVTVPEQQWTEAWKRGASMLKKGELSYMDLSLEAARPIRCIDLVGLKDNATEWLNGFLKRPGVIGDGNFKDGSGSFSDGKLFHETTLGDCPGYPMYELIHNGGTGRILYALAEHFFLTGDTVWFKKNQWRIQSAAEWIIRQRKLYMDEVPGRDSLLVAGLQPPQHIADTRYGHSQWYWYLIIDAWNCQGLKRFADAMQKIDPSNAEKYRLESEAYLKTVQKALDKAIALAPVMKVRNGTYHSYIPSIFYMRGPSAGQLWQLAMTDDDWGIMGAEALNYPRVDDVRLNGHLDVYEDVLTVKPVEKYWNGNDRFRILKERRREHGLPEQEDWFWGGFPSQPGYCYAANVYLKRDEISSFLRQWVNTYAAFVLPQYYYTFSEYFNYAVTAENRKWEIREIGYSGPSRNSHTLSYFMEQFRNLLVWEEGSTLWLAKATPRHWLEQGKKIAVKNAPTYFGKTSYEIISDVNNGKISATVEMPDRQELEKVVIRFRHPQNVPIKSVTVNGQSWKDFDAVKETVSLSGLTGEVKVECFY